MALAKQPLKELFEKYIDFTPTAVIARNISRWRILYETRDKHAEALNTPLLGINKLRFLPNDANALFDIVGVDPEAAELAIKNSSINNEFIVASNSFNLLVTWVAYKFMNSNLPKNVKEQTCIDVFYMLMLKFFSSLVNHWFPHTPKKEIMEATIESLSDKFDIKKEGTNTWKLVMLARANELVSSSNIHFNTLKTYKPDEKVTYILTDTQTRLRTKIKLVVLAFHEVHKKGGAVTESSIMEDDKESGEQRVKDIENNFGSMISSVANKALNINQFIRTDFVKVAASKAANVDTSMLKNVLIRFSTTATYQYKKQQQELVDSAGNYKGYLILIRNLIQTVYRQCVLDKINLRHKLAILEKASNMFKASRIIDQDIIRLRNSVERIVVESGVSRRPATIASLKIAFSLYIILLTFDLD